MPPPQRYETNSIRDLEFATSTLVVSYVALMHQQRFWLQLNKNKLRPYAENLVSCETTTATTQDKNIAYAGLSLSSQCA